MRNLRITISFLLLISILAAWMYTEETKSALHIAIQIVIAFGFGWGFSDLSKKLFD